MLPALDKETRKQKLEIVTAYFADHPKEKPASFNRVSDEINDLELIYLAHYVEQEGKSTSEVSTLAYLLDPESSRTTFSPKETSDHDQMIAYTMIQWLGSNVGMDFVRNSLEAAGYEVVKKEEKKKTILERIRNG
jgi:hypothetical protein